MAYDSTHQLMCQVSVGGDNGIYCWSPATGEIVDSITGNFDWTRYGQRGLAYRADDDTFYVGGWEDGVLYHIAGLSHPQKGAVLDRCTPADRSISGLAWNGSMQVVWAATNSYTDTIYELNPEDCSVLASLPHPTPGGYYGAGLELDQFGNLWTVSQQNNTAYLLESGVPSFSDVPWISAAPAAERPRTPSARSKRSTCTLSRWTHSGLRSRTPRPQMACTARLARERGGAASPPFRAIVHSTS